uniref:Hexosyltransferase n=1 Tax=Leersia perrieri TaxID=77586 RepID=A0A0D9X9B0_9ORYZ
MAAAAASSTSARRWRRWRWKWRTRDAVLALLVASVVAPPLLLDGGAPISHLPGHILIGSGSGHDPSNLIARREVRKGINALQQDASDAVKEPIQTVASDAAALKAGLVQHIVDQGSGMGRSTESRGAKDDGAHNVEKMVIAVDEKDGDKFGKASGLINGGKLGENKVLALGNARDLNIILNKGHTAGRSTEHATSEESDARAISSNTSHVHGRIREMELTLANVKQVHGNCAAAINKLQAVVHSTEEQMQTHKQEANYVTQAPANHVFHIVTDKLNYTAMRMWFLSNPQDKAVVEVQNIADFTWLNSSYSPVLRQLESHFMINYYFRIQHDKPDKTPKFRNPKYLSILNHLRFYLPEIFPKLNKVLFLDDDIVVQQDLTALWSIDLKGKVNGAVQTCGETFHRFDRYLNFSNPLIAKNFDCHACGWAYGMNMFDLSEWRKQNITDVYHYWQKLNEHRLLWKLGTLPAGLVTFWNRTFPLDHKWHLLGLGYKPNVNQKDIDRAAVIHYNGNRKPWLEIGVAKYQKYWSKYVSFDNVFIRKCNIHP